MPSCEAFSCFIVYFIKQPGIRNKSVKVIHVYGASMNRDIAAEEERALDEVAGKIKAFGKERANLIPILQMIQDNIGYLSPAAVKAAADHLDASIGDVYGVATFYNQFRFNPPGRNPIKVCLGAACYVTGAEIILENFERILEIKNGETTPDNEFSLEQVACVGCCALAPVAVVGDSVQGRLTPGKVEGLFVRFHIEREKQRKKRQNESC